MGVNQDDLRVIKTKRGLREAFIRLLLEKDYDAISIQDIATEAEAARVTFYRHYKNKEELLIECLKATYEGLAERMDEATEETVRQGASPVLPLYEHMQEQEVLYHILFSNRGTQLVIERLRQSIAERVIRQLRGRFPDAQLPVPLEIIGYHIASAQLGLAAWWLENDMPYPPEYMARVSFWLSMAGAIRGIGVESLGVPPPPYPENE